jgi:hypothetical protein
MAKPIDIAAMSGPAVFWIIFWEAVTNIGYFGLGMVVILIIAEIISWWFAFVLFLAFALVALLSVLHQLTTLGTNIVYFFSLVFGRGTGRSKAFLEYVFLSGANLIQLAEMALMVVYTLIIYEALYP